MAIVHYALEGEDVTLCSRYSTEEVAHTENESLVTCTICMHLIDYAKSQKDLKPQQRWSKFKGWKKKGKQK